MTYPLLMTLHLGISTLDGYLDWSPDCRGPLKPVLPTRASFFGNASSADFIMAIREMGIARVRPVETAATMALYGPAETNSDLKRLDTSMLSSSKVTCQC